RAVELARAVVEEPPPAPSLARARRKLGPVPEALELVCARALEKDPDARYASIAALAEDLERFLEGAAVRAPSTLSRAPSVWKTPEKAPLVVPRLPDALGDYE